MSNNPLKKALYFVDKFTDYGDDYPDFGDSSQPYFLYAFVERCGCCDIVTEFMSREEINEFIKDEYNQYDIVAILDVENNCQVYPKI